MDGGFEAAEVDQAVSKSVMLSHFLSTKQQQIALEVMNYVASIYESHNLRVVFGRPVEDLLKVIDSWPIPEDDVKAFWIIEGAVSIAFSGAPPHPRECHKWFTFSAEDDKAFMNYLRSLKPHYRSLVEQRMKQATKIEFDQ